MDRFDEDLKVTEHLASATLPASGGYSTQGYTEIPNDASGSKVRRLGVIVAYAKASAATMGQCKLLPLWTINGTADVASGIVDASAITPAEPFGGVKGYRMTLSCGQYSSSPSSGSEYYCLAVPPFATHVKILACEIGDTSHPGTCSVHICGAGE